MSTTEVANSTSTGEAAAADGEHSSKDVVLHQEHTVVPRKVDVDVICIGEVLVEFVAQESNVRLADVSTFVCAPGGAPANVAVGIQRLGSYQTAFVGKVGNDCFGIKLRTTLTRNNVDNTALFVDDKEPTTLVFDSVWTDGHKDLCFYRGADRFLQEEGEVSFVTEAMLGTTAQCCHFGSITFIDEPGASAQHKLLKQARDKGLMVTYDPNYRPTLWPNEVTARRVILDGYKYAHLAKISDEEWSVATGHTDLESGITSVLDCGVDLLVVTRGEHGAMATNGDFVIESPAITRGLVVVETTGAGDAFMAALITRLLPEFKKLGGSLKRIEREPVQLALDYANAVAGLTCTVAGAIPALPTKEAVDDFIGAHITCKESDSVSKDTTISSQRLSQMIDHTFLKPYGSPEDIERLCHEARQYQFAVVCVNPGEVQRCVRLVRGTNVRVGAAIGFPLGQNTTKVKVYETRVAIQDGATEIDMVLNVRELQDDNVDFVRSEIEEVVQACKEDGKDIICKVILETCYLTDEQKITACNICRDASVDFVKTSTGFGTAGATAGDVQLMRQTVGPNVGVKASGGIKTLATAEEMIAAGATRIGTSNSVAIMEEKLRQLALPVGEDE